MNKYDYDIGRIWFSFPTLKAARQYMKFVLRKDGSTHLLYRDNTGRYYIVRTNLQTMKTKRFYLK